MKYVLIILMGGLGIQLSYLGLGTANTKTEKFLKEQLEVQIMDIQEGKLAMDRASTESLRGYGELIVEEHTKMQKDLKDLAIQKNVKIPFQLSDKKANALSDLMEKHGTDFDKQFIKMMIIDHKRDVCCLKNALKSKDPDIKAFAETYLPVLQNHLEEAQGINQFMKQARP
jgi:putative membrane protein